MDNGETQLADGLHRFRRASGDELAVDIIDACIECNAIREHTKDKGNFAYVDEFRAWIQKTFAVDLSRGEAYELWKSIHLAHARAEQSFVDALNLPSSTAAGPTG